MAIGPGQEAPDFELADQDGYKVVLSDLRGHPVVLYFYPKASTPGCTTQACGVCNHRADYEQAGASGRVTDVLRKVKPADHDELALRALSAQTG
jgi:peroxiredoxin